MPYAYYDKLPPREQSIYRASDRVVAVPLPGAAQLASAVAGLEMCLERGERREVERAVRALGAGLLEQLGVPAARFEVLAVRPRQSWGELHGEYEPREGRRAARIRVWMRTARHKRVVAFRTFLRTLLHELCHHLDYELLGLADSYHTEGFFKRESSLFKQLLPPAQPSAAAD